MRIPNPHSIVSTLRGVRFRALAFSVFAFSSAILLAPAPGEAFPNCVALPPPTSTTFPTVCLGPGSSAPVTGYVHRYVTGFFCAVNCNVSMTNALACQVMPGSRLFAAFNNSTDTTGMGCDFDCGTRGKCTIRGADGLPVELLRFGVE